MPHSSASPRVRGEGIWRYLDISVPFFSLCLCALGLVMIYSATRNNRGLPPTYYVERQGIAIAVGLVLMIFVSLFDLRALRELIPFMYLGLLTLLAAVAIFGVKVNGARAWFQFGSLQFQPAELGKPLMIVALASFFTRDRAVEGEPMSLRRLFAGFAVAGVPMLLIMMQPDLGTVLIYAVITALMVLIAGARMRHVVMLAVILAAGTFLLFNSGTMANYQKDRLTVFLNPGRAGAEQKYNLEQAQVAISNGGIGGAGLFRGSQTRGRFVPEQQTDFIFTVVGEELGFVGGATLIGLFALLFLRLWRMAFVAGDSFTSLITVGVLAMFVFQVFQSIGMTLGIVPITGIPLPFVSYGGSSIITSFVSLGLVLGANMRRYS